MRLIRLLREAQFHGSTRLADENHKYFNYVWTVALGLLLWAAITVVCITVQRYMNNPTYLTQHQSTHQLMSCPSVLLCPEVSFPEYKMDAFVKEVKLPPGLNASRVRKAMGQLAVFFSMDVIYNVTDLEMLEEVLDFNELDLDSAGRRLTASCEETVIRCRFLGERLNCSSLFQMELTPYGYCCVFNGRSLKREIEIYGIHKVKPEIKWVTGEVGPRSAMTMVVNQSQTIGDVDLTYKWITLQGGQRYVDAIKNGTPLAPGTEHWAGYATEDFRIADDARALHHDLRRCRMSYEKLQYFPIYNKQYCLLECEMDRTMNNCGCLRVTHPGPPGVPICRANNLMCVKHNAVPVDNDQCNCLNTCDYDLDVLVRQTFDLMNDSFPYDGFYNGLNFNHVSITRVYLHSHGGRTSTREPYFDSIQLFSQLGGVFSVFFGCSILTLLELVQLLYHGLIATWAATNPNGNVSRSNVTTIPKKNKKIITMKAEVIKDMMKKTESVKVRKGIKRVIL